MNLRAAFAANLRRLWGMAAPLVRPCAGKAVFRTRAVAEVVADRMRRKRMAVHVYECRWCGDLHVGGAPPPGLKGAKRR